MKRLSLAVSIALLASGSAAPVIVAQAKPTPTYEAALARSWEEVHNKILTMAKDTVYPDNKLAWKPHPDSRSVMEELRHVTIGLEMTTAEARGEKFDFDAREKADAQALRATTTRGAKAMTRSARNRKTSHRENRLKNAKNGYIVTRKYTGLKTTSVTMPRLQHNQNTSRLAQSTANQPPTCDSGRGMRDQTAMAPAMTATCTQ